MRRETALKIIGLMRMRIYEGFTILQISKDLSIGYRPAYMHVLALQKEGVLTVKKVGGAKVCVLHLENQRCCQLLQEVDLQRKELLFQKNIKIKQVLEKLILQLTEKCIADIHSIVLFGSYVKGTQRKASDVDILFLVSDLKKKEVREEIERTCVSYQYSHNIKISPLVADIVEFKKMLKQKEMNVGKEAKEYGISLYGSEIFWRLVAWQE